MMSLGRLIGTRAIIMRMPSRFVHKGVECTPPMRYLSVSQRVGMYLFISAVCLSYPTYVLLSLDRIRPRADNSLNPEVQAEIERREAARRMSGRAVASPFV
ncbi:hypothetical protein Tcan_03903 [Toxocara canis]|uniref:Uncharacterized protein n=1 Tax=Toxocara canis TaxID=6265 RepID=A0A0B2UVJ4_TOXCA|nr:hypothetical protein Tcan_03903 [Toxocara canis]